MAARTYKQETLHHRQLCAGFLLLKGGVCSDEKWNDHALFQGAAYRGSSFQIPK
jgi:hypothetical protein